MAKKTKLTNDDIVNILSNELTNSNISEGTNNHLQQSLSYYLGNPFGNEIEGRSQIVSTDVADAVEWIMPQVMKSFTQNNEVVIFDAVNAEDEKQAELESQFVYDILMKENDGFILIHQFVKDALIQRNGILKVYYEEDDEVTTESYTGLVDEQLHMLVSEPNIEILTHDAYIETIDGQDITFHNVKIRITNKGGKICIDAVPPEQFRINSQHNSINVDNARFTAHVVQKTVSDLVASGYNKEEVSKLNQTDLNDSSYRFSLQNESTTIPEEYKNDPSSRLVEVSECYLKLDMDGDGISTLQKVTVGNSDPATVLLDVEEIDSNPWITTTAIIMSHKFNGLSIYDRLKQIQDNKSSIIRNTMDNIYLQNNQRIVVVDQQVNINDLQVSRPGGIVRAKRLDALMPLVTPQLGDAPFRMMEYLDGIRAGRTGVSPEGNATPESVGSAVGSEGYDRMMNAKEELAGLIIRVICETGIKPLCMRIRDLLIKHYDSPQDYKFRGQWVNVNPSGWIERNKCTVRVGTGTGDTGKQLTAINQIMQIQAQIFAMPNQSLVDQNKVFSAIDMFCKFSGLNGAENYFIDPSSPAGQETAAQTQQSQQAEQQKQQQITLEQLRVQAELAKSATTTAEAQQANVELKAQVELAKHQREMDKLTYESEKSSLEAQLKAADALLKEKTQSDKDSNEKEALMVNMALRLTEIEAKTKSNQDKNFIQNQKIVTANEESVDRVEENDD